MPPAARGAVDRVRDRIVLTEVQSGAECLDSRQDVVWQGDYTTRNPLEADDVVTLTTRSGQPAPAELATAAVSLHDVLAPWVDPIVIEAGGVPMVEIERGRVRDARPVASAAGLVPVAMVGATVLDAGQDGYDVDVARRCASGVTIGSPPADVGVAHPARVIRTRARSRTIRRAGRRPRRRVMGGGSRAWQPQRG